MTTEDKMVVYHILTGKTKEVPSGPVYTSWYTPDFTSVDSEESALKAEALNKRDSLLAATDWTANSDVTMSDAMRVYRQALRDVPLQGGFPDNVTWPEEP